MLHNGSEARTGQDREGLGQAWAVVAVAIAAALVASLGASALAGSLGASALAGSLGATVDAAPAQTGTFTLDSPDIRQGQTIAADQVFSGFGCKGRNRSPALSWSHPPVGTRSFALMVHDPDAPTEGGFWHWIVYNIPANASSIPAAAGDPQQRGMPSGVIQARNDFGASGYGGPCPPPGKPHHYHFRLFALKVPKLQLPADATAAMIGSNVNANKLAEADLMGLYGR